MIVGTIRTDATMIDYLPPALDVVRTKELLEIISETGDGFSNGKLLTDHVIEGNMRLIAYLVKRYNNNPSKSEDFFLEGVAELVRVVKHDKVHNGELAAHMTQRVRGLIWSSSSSREHRVDALSFATELTNYHRGEIDTNLHDVDINDLLDHICKDSRERTIIDKALRGLPAREIAEELKVSQQYVSKVYLEIIGRCKDHLIKIGY